jgi:hypothetical protein
MFTLYARFPACNLSRQNIPPPNIPIYSVNDALSHGLCVALVECLLSDIATRRYGPLDTFSEFCSDLPLPTLEKTESSAFCKKSAPSFLIHRQVDHTSKKFSISRSHPHRIRFLAARRCPSSLSSCQNEPNSKQNDAQLYKLRFRSPK